MSESREHKRRYNKRLEFIAHFELWMEREPPILLVWRWRKWLKERPVWEDFDRAD